MPDTHNTHSIFLQSFVLGDIRSYPSCMYTMSELVFVVVDVVVQQEERLVSSFRWMPLKKLKIRCSTERLVISINPTFQPMERDRLELVPLNLLTTPTVEH